VTTVLEAAPGMDLDTMRERSTAAIHWPSPKERHGVIQPSDAHHLRLRCRPDAHLDLPESKLTLVETRRGHACRLQTTPQPQYLDRPGALALAERLVTDLDTIGFVPDETLDATERDSSLAEHDRARLHTWTAPFGSGQWRAELWLRIAVRAESKLAELIRLPHDGCLLTLQLWDPPLLERQPIQVTP
jgi:hypothetical protein